MAISITAQPDNHYAVYDRAAAFEVESTEAAKTNFRFKIELIIGSTPVITIYKPPTYVDGGTAVLEFIPADMVKRYLTETAFRSMATTGVFDEANGWLLHKFRFTEVWDGSGSPANTTGNEVYCHNSIQDFNTSATKRSALLSRDVNEIFPVDSARQLSFFIDPALIVWYFIKATIYRGSGSRVKHLKGACGVELLQTPASGRVVAVFDAASLGLVAADTSFTIEAVLGYSSPGTPDVSGDPSVVGSVEAGTDPSTALVSTTGAHGISAGDMVIFTYEADDEESAPFEGYFRVIDAPETDELLIYLDTVEAYPGTLRVEKLEAFSSPSEGEVNSIASYIIKDLCFEEIAFKNRLGGWDVFPFRYIKTENIQAMRTTGRTDTGYLVTARDGVKQKTLGGIFIDNIEKVVDLQTSAAAVDMEGNQVALIQMTTVLGQLNELTDFEVTIQERYLEINE